MKAFNSKRASGKSSELEIHKNYNDTKVSKVENLLFFLILFNISTLGSPEGLMTTIIRNFYKYFG